jgi:hypothetical protein
MPEVHHRLALVAIGLRGIVSPMVTPLRDDDTVDYFLRVAQGTTPPAFDLDRQPAFARQRKTATAYGCRVPRRAARAAIS